MASLPSGVAALGSDSLLTFSQPELSFAVQILQLEEGLLPVPAEMSTLGCAGHHEILLAAWGAGDEGGIAFPLV